MVTSIKKTNIHQVPSGVDEDTSSPISGSKKIYVQGSRPDIQVAMREIDQTDTLTSEGSEENASLLVYDTSGPYTDPDKKVDLTKGLDPIRLSWIERRGDTELLQIRTSSFAKDQANDIDLHRLTFPNIPSQG